MAGEHARLRPLLAFCVVVLAASAAFIAAYRTTFRLPGGVIPAHVGSVAALLILALLVATSIQTVVRRPTRVVVLPLALLATALALLDVVSWVTRSLWVDDLSLATIAFYAPRVVGLAAGATAASGGWLLAAVVGVPASVLAGILHFAGPIGDGVFHAADVDRLALFGRRRARTWSLLATLAFAALLVAGYGAIKDRDAVRGEPLAGLFPGAPVAGTDAAALPRSHVLEVGRNGAVGRHDGPPAITVRPARKNVLIFVVDSLRADHVSSAGYARSTTPTLDGFVAGGHAIVADWATSSCSISACGIMAILGSAQYWRQHSHLPTLPDVLADAGYDLHFVSSGDFSRAYPQLHELYASRATTFVDGFTDERFGSLDDRRIPASVEALPPFAGRPAFFYFHLHSAHLGGAKYRAPTYRPALTDTSLWAQLTGPKRDDVQVVDDYTPAIRLNDYDNALLQADDVLASTLDGLGRRGYLDDAVVVITSDHGEELGEYGHLGHGHDLYAPSIDVPLVVHDRTFSGTRRVPYASHVDIAPTVAECVGVDAPASWEGHSLIAAQRAYSFHQTTHLQPLLAVVWRTTDGTFKYIVDTKTGSESLYELGHDPHETVDALAATDPAIVAALRAALAENFASVLPAQLAQRK